MDPRPCRDRAGAGPELRGAQARRPSGQSISRRLSGRFPPGDISPEDVAARRHRCRDVERTSTREANLMRLTLFKELDTQHSEGKRDTLLRHAVDRHAVE